MSPRFKSNEASELKSKAERSMEAKNIGLLMVKPTYSVHDADGSVLVEFDDGDSGRMVQTKTDGYPTVKLEGCEKFCFHSRKHFDEFVR